MSSTTGRGCLIPRPNNALLWSDPGGRETCVQVGALVRGERPRIRLLSDIMRAGRGDTLRGHELTGLPDSRTEIPGVVSATGNRASVRSKARMLMLAVRFLPEGVSAPPPSKAVVVPPPTGIGGDLGSGKKAEKADAESVMIMTPGERHARFRSRGQDGHLGPCGFGEGVRNATGSHAEGVHSMNPPPHNSLISNSCVQSACPYVEPRASTHHRTM